MNKGAWISSDTAFRYALLRQWDPALPLLLFIMLNPSTADANKDDSTIRKCIAFAKLLGFGGIVVVNLFAYRATKPKDLKAAGFPVGERNNSYLFRTLSEIETVVCAWGSNAATGPAKARADEVLKFIKGMGRVPQCLRLNDGGIPAHPLYLPYSCGLTPMEIA